MEKHDLAEQMFYLAQQIDPDCALCFYNIGNSFFIRADYKRAISCWLKTAQLEPTHPQINFRIAQAYCAQGLNDKSYEYFLAELRLSPSDTEVILEFGLFLLQNDKIEAAKEKFNRILEFEPGNALAFFYLGEIALDIDDIGKAAELFRKALVHNNTLTGARYRLAHCAIADGNIQTAKGLLIDELKLEPENEEILISMASFFIELDEIEYAKNSLLQAMNIDFANPDAYYYLGLCQLIEKNYAEAIEFFEHTLTIKADHLEALEKLSFARLAMRRNA